MGAEGGVGGEKVGDERGNVSQRLLLRFPTWGVSTIFRRRATSTDYFVRPSVYVRTCLSCMYVHMSNTHER